jgi:iron-regulated transporter 1
MLGLSGEEKDAGIVMYALFVASVVLACVEKLAFVANTVSVERDWIVVVSESLGTDRQELNSAMRRIDLVCKLIAPVGIGLVDGYSTRIAIWVVFAQNAVSVLVEYFAIANVYAAVPELGVGKGKQSETDTATESQPQHSSHQDTVSNAPSRRPTLLANITSHLQPYRAYVENPAFLASFSLSLLYLTVLSFASQMTTYLLTLGFTSTHVSIMRLVSVILELSATVAAPWLMSKIGAVRAGLWFINEQVLAIGLAIGLFHIFPTNTAPMLAGAALVLGVCLSRLGLWGFDLSVQYLVQGDAPPASRGSFSAIEMSLQNLFELLSFATTMVWYRPQDFTIPMLISAGAIVSSAACFAGFVRQKRGHLLHTNRCLKRMGGKKRMYQVLPTIEEEGDVEMDERDRR